MSIISVDCLSRSFSRDGFFLGLGEELESRLVLAPLALLALLALSGLLDADERRDSVAVLNCERFPWLRVKGFVSDWRRKASNLDCTSGYTAFEGRMDG